MWVLGDTLAYRVSLVGACVRALVGGICRAVLAVFHLSAGQDPAPVLIIAAVLGIISGVLAGVTGNV